jgi:hypothetical protein
MMLSSMAIMIGARNEALVLFTADGSGKPTGITLSHRNVIGSVVQWSSTLKMRRKDSLMASPTILPRRRRRTNSVVPSDKRDPRGHLLRAYRCRQECRAHRALRGHTPGNDSKHGARLSRAGTSETAWKRTDPYHRLGEIGAGTG